MLSLGYFPKLENARWKSKARIAKIGLLRSCIFAEVHEADRTLLLASHHSPPVASDTPSSLFSSSLSTKLQIQLRQLCGLMFTLSSFTCGQGLQRSVYSQPNTEPFQEAPFQKAMFLPDPGCVLLSSVSSLNLIKDGASSTKGPQGDQSFQVLF